MLHGVKVRKVAYALFCEQIKKVYICDGIEYIGESAFSYFNNLTSIELPNTITSIEQNAFTTFGQAFTINYKGTIADWLKIDINSNQGAGYGETTTIVCIDGSGTPKELEALREPEPVKPIGGDQRR